MSQNCNFAPLPGRRIVILTQILNFVFFKMELFRSEHKKDNEQMRVENSKLIATINKLKNLKVDFWFSFHHKTYIFDAKKIIIFLTFWRKNRQHLFEIKKSQMSKFARNIFFPKFRNPGCALRRTSSSARLKFWTLSTAISNRASKTPRVEKQFHQANFRVHHEIF